MCTNPRMRTVSQVAKHFKDLDPETQVTESFIRNVIASGFPIIQTGKKFFINLDNFIEYLNSDYTPGEKRAKNFSIIEK